MPLTGPIPVPSRTLPCARGGNGAWYCSACGTELAYGIVRPEALQAVAVRCPGCRSMQRLA